MIHVKLKSLEALARLACNFDYTNSVILSTISGRTVSIFAIAERIADIPIAFYINIPKRESLISYTYPTSDGQSENAHFAQEGEHDQSHYMNIIHMDQAIADAKRMPRKGFETVRLSSVNDLIITAIRRSVSAESLSSLYTFEYRNRHVICGFDLIDELRDDTATFYYALAKDMHRAKFARYKYSENRVDFTDFIGEHSYMYAKIINLAEPFPFFKMPE